MGEGRSEIIAGIRDLRAKAAAQLTGNAYYMIVQQLDSLERSADLNDEAAYSIYKTISAKLNDGAASATAGDPEVPSTPATPAEPDTPDTPEEPSTPDSPAHPEPSGDPEIPSPPTSPAEPPTPSEMVSAAENSDADSEQIITPRANSFSAPQATVAISFATVQDGEAADANGEPPRLTGLGTAADAALALARTQLSGNDYYTVANLLGTLRQLPGAPLEGGDAATPPGDFNGLLAVLRQEAGKLSGAAQDQATQLIGSLEGLLAPVPEQAAEAVQAETATSEAPPAEPAAPLTGFDKLADASWRRVEEVTQAERAQAQSLNGSAPPRAQAAPTATPEPTATPVESAQPETAPQQPQPVTPAAPPPVQPEQAETPQQATTPAPVEPKPTPAGAPPIRPAQAATPAAAEPMAEDMGEALNDGGSERRSSEPCYAGEFDHQLSATAADHQPASEKTEQAAEAAGETALSAEAETLSGADAAATSNAEAAADEMAAAAVAEELKSIAEAAAEIVAEQAESVSTPFPATGTAEAPSEGAPAASIADAGTTLASQAVAEATAAEQPASEPPPADQTASTAPVGVQSEAVASAERADAQSAAAEQTEPPLEKAAEKSARGGFFNRLFGSGSSKHQ